MTSGGQPAALADDHCPRCGSGFHCGANDAAPCACSTLTLPPELLASLRQRYSGCLCLRCLQALSAPAGMPAGGAAVSGVPPGT